MLLGNGTRKRPVASRRKSNSELSDNSQREALRLSAFCAVAFQHRGWEGGGNGAFFPRAFNCGLKLFLQSLRRAPSFGNVGCEGNYGGRGAGFGCPILRTFESVFRRGWLNNARIQRGRRQAGKARRWVWRGNFRRAWPQGRRCAVAGGWHHGEARRRLRIDAKARQVAQLDGLDPTVVSPPAKSLNRSAAGPPCRARSGRKGSHAPRSAGSGRANPWA